MMIVGLLLYIYWPFILFFVGCYFVYLTYVFIKKDNEEIMFNVKAWGGIIVGIFFLYFSLRAFVFFTSPTKVDKGDIIGTYIIDRSKYPGKQADWQYNHYRFEVTKENEIILYYTEGGEVVSTIKRDVYFIPHKSTRLAFYPDQNNHHILSSSPTLYRKKWTFYYVFKSKYGDMYFKKGKWKPID